MAELINMEVITNNKYIFLQEVMIEGACQKNLKNKIRCEIKAEFDHQIHAQNAKRVLIR